MATSKENMAQRYAIQRRTQLFGKWETLWTDNGNWPVDLDNGDGTVTNAGRAADLVGQKLWSRHSGTKQRQRIRVVAV